jgi:hypothetical protein
MIEKFQTLEVRGRKSSKPWKFFAVLFPMLGSLAMAQGPGSLSQGGFFQAWWGAQAFNPRALPNLIFWIDASLADTVNVDGGRVAAITDLSTNAYTVQQLTTANRPAYLTAAKNGLNAMGFTGASNHLLNVTSIAIPNSHTVFSVFRRGTSGVNTVPLGGTSPYPFLWFTDNFVYQLSSVTFTTHGTANTNTGWFYVTTRRTGTTQMRVRRNGATLSDVTTGAGITSPASGDWSAIGRASTFNYNTTGDIAEVVVYNRALSDEEVLQVEAYLARKWGI